MRNSSVLAGLPYLELASNILPVITDASISAPEKSTLVALSQPAPHAAAIFIDENDALILKCTPDFAKGKDRDNHLSIQFHPVKAGRSAPRIKPSEGAFFSPKFCA